MAPTFPLCRGCHLRTDASFVWAPEASNRQAGAGTPPAYSRVRQLSFPRHLPMASFLVKRSTFLFALVTLVFAVTLLLSLGRAQAQSFNPRDLSGVWWVNAPGPETIFARAKGKDTSKCESCHP